MLSLTQLGPRRFNSQISAHLIEIPPSVTQKRRNKCLRHLTLKWTGGRNRYLNIVSSLTLSVRDRFRDICAVRQTSFESSTEPEFVRQSIYLHAYYHKFKMWVRRPYTLPNRKDSPLAPAATAMCTSSAVTSLNLLYKLKGQLDVDLMHYEVPSQVFGPRNPGADELEIVRVQSFQ